MFPGCDDWIGTEAGKNQSINTKLLNVVIFGYISGISFKYLILQEINYTIMTKDKGSKKEGGKKAAVKSLKEKRAGKKEKQAEKRRKD
ncbi:hypothetical protein GCM10011386_14040 [Parapedobacter defluvii]|uniref:Uncharacterized protein n=1 Tax=Parapedobacter defluvii TaxID=2045106 RepID=A0ABQ1LFY8_9SPHI|nr:hypothetical protein GCM10011386_14040 [Parapedobacter defluvii]